MIQHLSCKIAELYNFFFYQKSQKLLNYVSAKKYLLKFSFVNRLNLVEDIILSFNR